MPMIALLLIAFVSLISGFVTIWSVMPSDMRSGAALLILSITSLFAAGLFFAQSRGVASLLPMRVQDSLVNMSILDVAQKIWHVTGDVADAALVVGLRMDPDHAQHAISRLPAPVRTTLTHPGIINLVPRVISDLILPAHVRARFLRPRDVTAAPVCPNLQQEPPFLTPIIVEVSERRIRSLAATFFDMYLRQNPLIRLSLSHYRTVVSFFTAISLFQVVKSRTARGATFKLLQALVFLSALSISGNVYANLRPRRQLPHVAADEGQRTTSPVIPSGNKLTTFQRGLIISAAAATAFGLYRRTLRNKAIRRY